MTTQKMARRANGGPLNRAGAGIRQDDVLYRAARCRSSRSFRVTRPHRPNAVKRRQRSVVGPNYDAAIEFLRKLYPEGPWVLTAIEPDGPGIETRTYGPNTEAKCRAWLADNGASRNVYYSVNPTKRRVRKKPERKDIAAVYYLHADLDVRAGEDPAAEKDKMLRALETGGSKRLRAPTVIVMSGGGYNALWKLDEPIVTDGDGAKIELATRYNVGVRDSFSFCGADGVQNIDRILRLPGTVNRPDAKKREKGRAEALATVVDEGWADRLYSLSALFPEGPPEIDGAGPRVRVDPANVRRLGSVDELGGAVPDRVKAAIVQGKDPDEPQRHPSRSEWLFWVCCEMVRAGLDDDTIFAVITDSDFGISASVVDKGSSAHAYALRQIERARAEAEEPELGELNEKHAVIANWGGRCRVTEEVYTEALRRYRLTRQSFEDFRNRYLNRRVKVATTKDGEAIYEPLGKWWLKHPLRRQYERIEFAPERELPDDVLNLWRGFACAAERGDCGLYLAHLRDNVCRGDERLYGYLLNWMAYAVQNPDEPGHVAVVLKGRMGTGKSFAVKQFGSLFGRHFLQVTDPKHLVGSFNAHLRDCVVLFGDEAFFAGDKQHERILKGLITEDTITIEAKGIDAETSPNRVHLLMASNERWVVPAAFDDRRFFVVEVGEERMRDTPYFRAIAEQMDSGGREALLWELKHRDLSGFEVRDFPETAAHAEQQTLSLKGAAKWVYEGLSGGSIPAHGTTMGGGIFVATSLWLEEKPKRRDDDDVNVTNLGRELAEVAEHHDREYVETYGKTKRLAGWWLPPLKEARAKWEKVKGKRPTWPDQPEHWDDADVAEDG